MRCGQIARYSEPLYATFGNSYCDIENDSTGQNPVFGLCSQFRIAEVAAGYVLPIDQYALSLNADAQQRFAISLRCVLFALQ